MKKILIIIFSFLYYTNEAIPCGPSWSEEDEYYNLMNFESIFESPIHEGIYSGREENLEQWFLFFEKQIPKETLENWVYTSSSTIIQNLLDSKKASYKVLKKEKSKEALKYILVLKSAVNHSKIYDKWGYTEETDKDKEILANFEILFEETENLEIKQRVLYQIIRFSRYNGEIEKALGIYYNNEKLAHHPSAIHYYIMDQVAGILPNQNEQISMFFQVAFNSLDRKSSALSSLRLFRINHLYIYGLNTESDAKDFLNRLDIKKASLYQKLDTMYTINQESKYIDYLILSKIKDLNYYLLPRKEFGYNYYHSSYTQDNEVLKNISKAKKETQELLDWIEGHKISNKLDFQKLYAIQLNIGLENFERANEILATIDKSKFEEKTIQSVKLQIMANRLDVKDENSLDAFATVFEKWLKDKPNHYYGNGTLGNYCRQIISGKLNIDNQIARSFLMENDLLGIDYSDTEMLKTIKTFLEKYPNTKFDNTMLLLSSDKKYDLDKIYEKMSVYYLSTLDIENYREYDSKLSKNYKKQYFINNISEKVFKTYSIPYRKNTYIDNDDYLANYKFIAKTKNRETLVKTIEKLIKLSEKGSKGDKMWANFILANFTYNISDFGYNYALEGYRNNVSTNTRQTSDIMKNFKNSNFSGYWLYEHLDTKQLDVSSSYYKKALELTNSDEFKAKILFLLARNEQDVFYTEVLYNYDFKIGDKRIDNFWSDELQNTISEIQKDEYQNYFKVLITKYSATETYRTYYSNCSNLRDYEK